MTYYKEHPQASQREIAAALNVSVGCVNKWVKYCKEQTASEGE